jgi:hypothetical protein
VEAGLKAPSSPRYHHNEHNAPPAVALTLLSRSNFTTGFAAPKIDTKPDVELHDPAARLQVGFGEIASKEHTHVQPD